MIYFIEAVGTGRVKIGYTASDPESRLKALQTGCPHSLRIMATTDGGQELEQLAHKQFERLRETGEWFRLDEPLSSFIFMLQLMNSHLQDIRDDILNLHVRHDSVSSWVWQTDDKDENGKQLSRFQVIDDDLDAHSDRIEGAEIDIAQLWPVIRQLQDTALLHDRRIDRLESTDSDILSGRSLAADCRA